MVNQTRQPGSKGKDNKPGGKHKKSYKKLIKIIEGLGFEFVSSKNHLKYRHPERSCSITIASTPSSKNAMKSIINNVKRALLQCQPPIDVKQIPAELNQLRLFSKMDEAQTVSDLMDACITEFSKITTEMNTDAKEELKMLSQQKGMTMGGVIEEMIDVYKNAQ